MPVVVGGESVISHAGGVLLAQTAQVCGLDQALSSAVRPWRRSRAMHDPAKILLDLAIAVALGGDCAADIALLRGQPEVFGSVASDPTVSRGIDDLADAGTDALTARAPAPGYGSGPGRRPRTGGSCWTPTRPLLTSHSEKEDAAKTWKKSFGFHPLLVFCDHGESGTGEPVAGLFRRGNAGSNTAADHLAVLDDALAQIPAHLRRPDLDGKIKVLVRTDAAGVQAAVGRCQMERLPLSSGAGRPWPKNSTIVWPEFPGSACLRSATVRPMSSGST
jgi:hypothetical protein